MKVGVRVYKSTPPQENHLKQRRIYEILKMGYHYRSMDEKEDIYFRSLIYGLMVWPEQGDVLLRRIQRPALYRVRIPQVLGSLSIFFLAVFPFITARKVVKECRSVRRYDYIRQWLDWSKLRGVKDSAIGNSYWFTQWARYWKRNVSWVMFCVKVLNRLGSQVVVW